MEIQYWDIVNLVIQVFIIVIGLWLIKTNLQIHRRLNDQEKNNGKCHRNDS